MIIQYANKEDYYIAKMVRDAIGGTLIFYPSGVLVPNEDMVMIGGQIANPTYDYFARFNPNWIIYESTAGYGFINTGLWSSNRVWGIAGWNMIDTASAARYVVINGLPNGRITAVSSKELHLVRYTVSNEWIAWFNSYSGQVMNRIQGYFNRVGDYEILWGKVEGNEFEMLIETHSPFSWEVVAGIALLGIGMVMLATGVLAPLGIGTIGSACFYISGTVLITVGAVSLGRYLIFGPPGAVANCVEKFMSEYNLSAEEALAICQSAYPGVNKYFKYAITLILVGAGAYFLIAYGVPLLKKITKV